MHNSSICTSVTKCTIMYYEQPAGPRSANFSHMHVDKVPSPANVQLNCQRPWPSFSWSKIVIEYIGKCIIHSTSLFHSYHLTRNRQSTLSIIWFILWSWSCSYHRTKENFQRNISNYTLNSKSLHNHRYLPFHFKIIHNQSTVKKTFTQ